MSEGARRGHQFPEQLKVSMWVLGAEPRASAEQQQELNHCAISPAPINCVREGGHLRTGTSAKACPDCSNVATGDRLLDCQTT